ncbi:MAG: glycosyltransferase [Verrucomicrobiota bacterium]|jgi:glycosyltransferase involved in cell wall biosynthesis
MSAPASVRRRVLLVIPAYNEEARLEPPLRSYLAYARDRADLEVRFLVVLNGCRDGTAALVERLASVFPELSWMEYTGPIGKGGALLAGFRQAGDAEWVGFADADGATPAASLFALLDAPVKDVMVGRRVMSTRPFGRRVTSFGFNLTVRVLLGLRTRDTQCGAKFFRAAFLPAILAQADTCDMAVDVDLLLAAKSAGAAIGERTVDWADQPGSKVRVFHTSSLMFLSVCRLFFLRRVPRLLGRPFARLGEWFYAAIAGRSRQALPGEPNRVSLR